MAYALQAQRVALQFLQGTIALADNMRNNASQWLAWLSGALDGSPGNPTLVQIATAMNNNSTSWTNTINAAQAWGANNNALATSAAAWLGSTLSAVNTDLNSLKATCSALAAADKTSAANAQAAANAVLSSVPAAPTIF